MVYTLAHFGLRIFIFPESTHSSWNDVRNAIRRAGLQHVLLLSLTIANVGSGPFGSGRNKQSMQEAAEELSQSMSSDEFDNLLDMMIQDRCLQCDDGCDHESLPTTPGDIPKLPIVANHMTFATCLCLKIHTHTPVHVFNSLYVVLEDPLRNHHWIIIIV